MTENEIVKKWKTEIHLAEYVDSEYRDNVQVSLIRATVKELERQQAEISLKTEYIQEQRDVIDELKDEIEKLNKAMDRIVEELEKRKLYNESTYKTYEGATFAQIYKIQAKTYNEAIEIVKAGGNDE